MSIKWFFLKIFFREKHKELFGYLCLYFKILIGLSEYIKEATKILYKFINCLKQWCVGF